jgi:hypothetical protein
MFAWELVDQLHGHGPDDAVAGLDAASGEPD